MMKRNDGNADLVLGFACIRVDFQLLIQAGSSCRALVRTAKRCGQCEGAAAAALHLIFLSFLAREEQLEYVFYND